jgi:starch-binding outer membrane protein, SusD/RagB family
VLEDFPLGSTPPPQATRQQLFDFIVSELTAIRSQLPPASFATYGRATDVAAAMLLAKLYLNAEVYTGAARYAEALAETQTVINGPFTLDPLYRRPFLADNHTSPEIIFPIIQDGEHTQTWGGMTFLVHAACGGSMNANALGVDGCWFGLRLKPEAYNRFAPGDPRTSYFFSDGQTVEVTSISNFNAGIAAPKFQNVTSTGSPGSSQVHVDTDFPMFRLADAYLMYAEAHLRGGGGTPELALGYVNAIRQRTYGDNSADITAGELTLDFVLDERGRELLWEAHRRTDLIRYGRFTGGDYVWSWKGGVQAGTTTETFRNLYPLPASELVTNTNLTQNPGY